MIVTPASIKALMTSPGVVIFRAVLKTPRRSTAKLQWW